MTSVQSVIKWLAVVGSVLALGGTLTMVADHWQPFHGLVDRLSVFGRAQKGWGTLADVRYKDTSGHDYGALSEDEVGFREVLHIIQANRPEYRTKEVSEIICKEVMRYTLGQTSVSQSYISLLVAGQTTPDVISSKEHVEEWISIARLRHILFWGFLFILIGFVLALPVSIFQVLPRNCK